MWWSLPATLPAGWQVVQNDANEFEYYTGDQGSQDGPAGYLHVRLSANSEWIHLRRDSAGGQASSRASSLRIEWWSRREQAAALITRMLPGELVVDIALDMPTGEEVAMMQLTCRAWHAYLQANEYRLIHKHGLSLRAAARRWALGQMPQQVRVSTWCIRPTMLFCVAGPRAGKGESSCSPVNSSARSYTPLIRVRDLKNMTMRFRNTTVRFKIRPLNDRSI